MFVHLSTFNSQSCVRLVKCIKILSETFGKSENSKNFNWAKFSTNFPSPSPTCLNFRNRSSVKLESSDRNFNEFPWLSEIPLETNVREFRKVSCRKSGNPSEAEIELHRNNDICFKFPKCGKKYFNALSEKFSSVTKLCKFVCVLAIECTLHTVFLQPKNSTELREEICEIFLRSCGEMTVFVRLIRGVEVQKRLYKEQFKNWNLREKN